MDAGQAPRGTFAPVDLTTGRPPLGRWLAIAAIALVVVVVKPWSSAGTSAGGAGASGMAVGSVAGGGAGAVAGSPSPAVPAAAPTTPAEGARQVVAAFCLEPSAWLIASVERWRDQRIRVWRALEPVTAASGPDDPVIPIVPVVSEGVTELGWCAPVVGAGMPTGPADIAVWRRSPAGAAPIVVDSSRPVSDRSPFGELYRPPGLGPSSKAASWPAGTYVFRYREGDGRERWFAVGVEIHPRPSVTP